ncbi:hypothetical protein XU18_0434 [Perkinsela sp. CCAP 1560/4]|nr:hypothetical protein XU18_0434 [Perkinsela sp. CCAP 1560/4]|eukprot:KNH09749.1 hypothetical protein XU18_0434 [Perkinsela sp. CCAP 1560/4]
MPGQILMFWANLAGHCSHAEIVKSIHVNKNIARLLVRAVGVTCYKCFSTCDVKLSRLAVDETYFGKRKYNRGKRTRHKERACTFEQSITSRANGGFQPRQI